MIINAPDTLYLISGDDDFVALPDKDGKFPSMQSYRTWQVEGMACRQSLLVLVDATPFPELIPLFTALVEEL